MSHVLNTEKGTASAGDFSNHLGLVPPLTDEGQQAQRLQGQPKPHSQLVTSLGLEPRPQALCSGLTE